MDIIDRLEALKSDPLLLHDPIHASRVVEDAIAEIGALRAELIPRKYLGCCLSCGNRYHFFYCRWMKHPEEFGCDNWSTKTDFKFQGCQPQYIPENDLCQKRSSLEA